MPRDYKERLGELRSGKKLSVTEKLKGISDFLETKKDAAIDAVDEEKAKNSSSRQSYQSTRVKKEASEEGLDNEKQKCEFCSGSNCKTEWSGFGCLDMYKLASRDERIEWLKERHLCFKCELSFKRNDECRGIEEGLPNAQFRIASLALLLVPGITSRIYQMS